MVTEHKRLYMKRYNQMRHVKAKKAEYMRRVRAAKDSDAARNLVRTLLDLGHEQLAFEYAQERCPEMLVTVKAKTGKK
ncbi:MAG: hypothetical protein V1839_01985 [archaeon]